MARWQFVARWQLTYCVTAFRGLRRFECECMSAAHRLMVIKTAWRELGGLSIRIALRLTARSIPTPIATSSAVLSPGIRVEATRSCAVPRQVADVAARRRCRR